MDAADQPVASPCVSVCALDASGRTCTACRRTIDEIVGWAAMSDDARRAVLARVRAAG